MKNKRIAIVGAGMTGLSCATRLTHNGFSVTLFDKARGPSGRLSTRRFGGHTFDHGASYFTAAHIDFCHQVDVWHQAGVAAPWHGRFGTWAKDAWTPLKTTTTRWVGSPRMSALCRHMAQGFNVHYQTQIQHLKRQVDQWTCVDQHNEFHDGFDAVILTCPSPQAHALLNPESTLHDASAQPKYAAVWSLMMALESVATLPFDGIHFNHPTLSWAARDSSKPGRTSTGHWVVHATPSWTAQRLTSCPDEVAAELSATFRQLTGAPRGQCMVHRWLYAQPEAQQTKPALWDAERSLGLCGDAWSQASVEGAWLSGQAMAQHIDRPSPH